MDGAEDAPGAKDRALKKHRDGCLDQAQRHVLQLRRGPPLANRGDDGPDPVDGEARGDQRQYEEDELFKRAKQRALPRNMSSKAGAGVASPTFASIIEPNYNRSSMASVTSNKSAVVP